MPSKVKEAIIKVMTHFLDSLSLINDHFVIIITKTDKALISFNRSLMT